MERDVSLFAKYPSDERVPQTDPLMLALEVGPNPIPTLSIIVPTLNSSATLPRLLTSIRQQSTGFVEVIVVDGGSSDSTIEIALSFGATVLPGKDISQSRNLGANAAHSDFLLFLDSDMELAAGFISACKSKAEAFSILYFREISASDGLWARARIFEKQCAFGSGVFEAPRWFTKKSFRELGGYDERFASSLEDMELQARVMGSAHTCAWVDNPPIIHHEEGLGFVEYLIKRRPKKLRTLMSARPEFWGLFASPAARLRNLFRGLLEHPGPTNLVLFSLVLLQRSAEYVVRR